MAALNTHTGEPPMGTSRGARGLTRKIIPGRQRLIRDFHAGQYVDLFLAAAVSAVLVIRLFLHLTGYPQAGGEELHIAHMLWGGLLMLVAMILLLAYVGRGVNQIAAFVGGVGFGTFIDEVGKFVTQDNDYFYRPAVALIYITFVLTYLVTRSLRSGDRASPEEYLINALQEIENVAVNDLDPDERDRALAYLGRSDQTNELVLALQEVVQRAGTVPTPDPTRLVRARRAAVGLYRRVVKRPEFVRLIIVFFVAQLVLNITHVLAIVFQIDLQLLANALPATPRTVEELGFTEWAQLASTAFAGVFVAFGVIAIRRSRLQAFRMFQRAILVSILLTQVFVFVRDEWAALTVLVFNLLVLLALNFVIEQEAAREQVQAT